MERAKRNHPYGASEGCHTKLILSSFLASFFTVPFFSVTFFTLLFSATLFTLPFFSRLFLRCLSLGDCVFTPFIASFLATSFRDFYFATFFPRLFCYDFYRGLRAQHVRENGVVKSSSKSSATEKTTKEVK